MKRDEIVVAVQQAVNEAGGKVWPIEQRARLPQDSIRSILKGREPGVFRMADICAALGLEFYIGPPRAAPPPVELEGAASVADREIAAVIAVLADEYDELDAPRRAGLLTRFRSCFPDLREREKAGEGRRLSRLAGG